MSEKFKGDTPSQERPTVEYSDKDGNVEKYNLVEVEIDIEDTPKDSAGSRGLWREALEKAVGFKVAEMKKLEGEDIRIKFSNGNHTDVSVSYDPEAKDGEKWEARGIRSPWSDRW